MPRYYDDPRWIPTRYESHCCKCGRLIRKGDQIFYYPKGRKVYCADACGTDAYQDFLTHAQDEEVLR